MFGRRRLVEAGPKALTLNASEDSDVKNSNRALCKKRKHRSLALAFMTLSYQDVILVNKRNKWLEYGFGT